MFKQLVLTLDATSQRLSDAFGDGVGVINAAKDIPCTTLTLQSLKTNTNDILIGDSSLTAALHAFRIDATDTQPPLILTSVEGAPLKVSDLFALGTAGEKLLIGMVGQ